ncbi:MAG: hypothetical protein IT233_03180 [Bacteroidia bacterium]|nr:hypothetical protein [Bacteroidia bacterium]
MRIFLLLLMTAAQIAAQSPPLRIEIEAGQSDDYYVVPAAGLGLVLFYANNEKRVKDKNVFTFEMYNTELQQTWKKNFPVTSGLEFCKYTTEGSRLYVLLTEEKKNSVFEIIHLDLSSGEIISITGRVPYKTRFEDFVVVSGLAYLGGRTLPTETTVFARTCFTYALCCVPAFFGGFEFKFQPVLYVADVSNGGRSQPLVLPYSGSAAITDLAADTISGLAQTVILHRPDKNEFKMEVKDFRGKDLAGSIRISSGGNNELLYGRVNPLADKGKLVIGTYGLPVKYKSFSERLSRASGRTSAPATSNGLFIAKIAEGEQEYIRYYPFSGFQSFWNDTKDRFPGANENKKTEGRIGYHLLVHNVIERNNEYIVISEAYFPEYETRTDYYFDPNGNYVPRTTQVFVGYRYTHALIAAFSKDGEKLWDNSFEIMDILTFNLKERVKVMFEGDNIVLAYSIAGSIRSKVISGNQVVDGKQTTVIETNYPEDLVKSSWGSDMEFWYDNYFLTWGFQRIKNSGKDGNGKNGKRTVFYFNKIAFQ